MKTLAAWIAGIFALGLALGGLVSVSSNDALEDAPAVDCGEGREALYERVVVAGEPSYKVRCVSSEPAAGSARHTHVAPAPTPAKRVPAPRDVDDSRSWKESAVVIGGAAGTGAGIGAIAKGKKGAAVGAAIGAATGAAYELMKKDKKN